MAFTLKIDTANAAFEDRPAAEVARILRDVAEHLSDIDPERDSAVVHDYNGNNVGEWVLS